MTFQSRFELGGEGMAPDTDRPEVELHLWGTFALRSATGRDLTPKLGKCQALLALLATDPTGARTRGWLQSRLWSDRGKDQASGSLRQALSAIRRALGPAAGILGADRQRVALDMTRVRLVPGAPGAEFLEGLDIRDEEFEDWLRLERSHRETERPAPAPRQSPNPAAPTALITVDSVGPPTVLLLGSAAPAPDLAPVETFLIDSLAQALRENIAVRAFTRPMSHPPGAIQVRLSADRSATDQIFLSAQCEHGGNTELLWSGHQIVRLAGGFPFEDMEVLRWINQIVAAIADLLGRAAWTSAERQTATVLGLSALRELFSMDPARVIQADALLARAHDADPRGVFLAWRAQLRAIQSVERHALDAQTLRQEGLAFAQTALEAEPQNSTVLAAVSNARLILDKDLVGCDALSRMSVEVNGANPLAWWSRSLAFLYSDRRENAYQSAVRGHALAAASPYRFWWELQVALAAAVTGRRDAAILSAERCAALSPEFRPPLRYLTGLYAGRGAVDRANRAARRLTRLEPDFAPERLLADGDYPASLLRTYNLIRPDDLVRLADAP